MKLIIDLAGIVQRELVASNCRHHASVVESVRYLLGQFCNVTVVELDTPEQQLYIAQQIKHLRAIAFGE